MLNVIFANELLLKIICSREISLSLHRLIRGDDNNRSVYLDYNELVSNEWFTTKKYFFLNSL